MCNVKTTEEKLAGSLTAETTDLLPFLPYLLQDFWELGSDPSATAKMLFRNVAITENTRVLDLACGKGAVSVAVAKKLQAKVKGIDLIPEFVEVAAKKAVEHGVSHLCEFLAGDINDAVETEKNFDVVIFGAAGDALGNPRETLRKLKQTIRSGGYILIDEGYLKDGYTQENIGYTNYEYLTKSEWDALFEEAGLTIAESLFVCESEDGAGIAEITRRANELSAKHPEKKSMFDGYIRSQQSEYDDIDNSLEAVIWLLKGR
jgi:SAM-dependent methyltransferase